MYEEVAAPDAAIAHLAARQHGVVATSQLRELGVSKDATRVRVRAGRLHRLHQGVYTVGHPGMTDERRWMAAVLACAGFGGIDARDAFLSHRSAAALWQLLAPEAGLVDVAIVGEAGRAKRSGLRVHRPRTLESAMTTRRYGIPVTDPRRTIADLRRAKPSRGGAGPAQLRRAMRQAAILRLPLGPDTSPERTRSDLETLFLRICRRNGIPAPDVNVWVEGLLVDFFWPDRHAIVETDGYRYHRGRVAFENDRARDLELRRLGFDVIRLADTQLENEPGKVASAVQRLLAAT
jgi:hypothetical protein